MQQVKACVLCIMASFGLLSQTVADEIVIVSDAWPPFNSTPGTENPGYMVEVARAIFEKAGHTVVYKKVPWTRAVNDTRLGRYNAIIAAAQTDAPDFIFPEEEQGRLTYSFFTKTASEWVYDGLPSLKTQQLGVINLYTYTEELDAYVAKHQSSDQVQIVFGNRPLEQNMNKLMADRISVFIDDEMVTAYTAQQMGIEDDIRNAGALVSKKVYLAFAPNLPESTTYASLLSNGMKELRATGELQAILDRYGLTDWK